MSDELASTTDALKMAFSAGPYIAGGSFTAADVYVGSQVAWGLLFNTTGNEMPSKPTRRALPIEMPTGALTNSMGPWASSSMSRQGKRRYE
ncbi:MAG: hypothetical protein AB8B57_01775 [Congregibacter sp.]